jgi:hypothetical protein
MLFVSRNGRDIRREVGAPPLRLHMWLVAPIMLPVECDSAELLGGNPVLHGRLPGGGEVTFRFGKGIECHFL